MDEMEARRRTAVLRLIEGDIVPQLAEAYRQRDSRPLDGAQGPRPGPGLIIAFAGAALRGDAAAMTVQVERQQTGGLTNESVLLDFLGPAVCHLGELWLQDRCSFCDVTVAVSTVRQQMHAFLCELPYGAWSDRRSIVVWPVPGDVHTFGSAMVAELFRLRGWSVHHSALHDPLQIAPVLAVRSFALVGFSMGDARLLAMLEECIRAVRLTSCNREMMVMVGGAAFAARDGLADSLDVDVVAYGAEEALLQAELLLERDPIVPFPATRLTRLAASHGVVEWNG